MNNNGTSAFLVSMRRKRRNKRAQKNKRIQPWAYLTSTIFSLAFVSLVFWGIFLYSRVAQNLPSVDLLPLMIEPRNDYDMMPTRIFDRDGEILIYSHQNPNAESSQYIPFEQIPEDLIQAVLISKAPDYWEKSNYQFPFNIEISPITSNIVSRFLFVDDIPESAFTLNLISLQVESKFGKEKILEWYLNSSDFGNLAFGIDRASRVYFGKSVIDLELAECSMLAAILNAPAANPIDSITLAIMHQENILDELVAVEYIKDVQAQKALNKELGILTKSVPETSIAAEYIILILEEISKTIGENQLMYGGVDIISTLNHDLQVAVECTTELQINRISGEINPNAISDSECDASRLLPSLGIEDIASADGLLASVVIIDSSTGEVLAYWGDPQELKQPGTIISPFIYLTAFTRGYSPANMVWDIPANIPVGAENYLSSSTEFQGPVRIRTALSNNLITPALHILSQIGIENVWYTANNSGIKSLQFSSGGNLFETIFSARSVNLLELTHSYTVFSNNGKLAGAESHDNYIETPMPALIKNIYINDPEQVDIERISTSIVAPEYSYLITDILSDSVSRLLSWNAGNPLEIGFDSAVLTSSSSENDQHFIIGYSPDLTIGVWVGYADTNGTNPHISKYAVSGLWHALMRYSHFDSPPDDFIIPAGINRVEVCDPSGMLPTTNCPKIVSEVFVDGTEPKYPDTFFKVVQINEQTGLLATVTTPPELIIENIFMDIPAEALNWAIDSGIEIPPSSYDLTYDDNIQNQDVMISSPDNFSYINNELLIIGSAKGDQFDSYKLEYGKGISPQQWQQIGETSEEKIFEDVLGIWDTSDLEGLYAIRLQVVNTNYSVITDVVQVTIDNQNPHLQINFPLDDQIFDIESDEYIPIQISTSDNILLSYVEFYVDDELIITLSDHPYTTLWESQEGEFTIRVIAYDEAGNSSSSEILILVE